MLQALNHFSKIRPITLTLLLAMLAISATLKAQPFPRSNTLRITDYRSDRDLIRGRGVPFSTIKFYYAAPGSFTPLPGAQPIKEVTADDTGFWFFSPTFENMGYFTGPVVVSMTLPGGTQEAFESPILGPDEVFINNPQSCTDKKDLYMTFAYNEGETQWRDARGNLMGNLPTLLNANPGTYTVEYTNIDVRTYKSNSLTFEGIPKAQPADLFLNCSETHLDYTGLYDGVGAKFLWTNQADGSIVGTTNRVRLPEGKYNYYVTNNQDCQSAPATITVHAGPVLARVDTRGKQVAETECARKTGSITGIIVIPEPNQTPKYRWRDTVGNEYHTLDIYNLAAGKYTLEAYTDDNSCPTILIEEEILEKNAVILDESQYVPGPTSCGLNNGSITGLSTNATIIKWYKGLDRTTVISTSLDLTDRAPDFYTIVVANEYGCSDEKTFHIFDGSPAVELLSPPVIKNDTCNLQKGSLTGPRFNTSVTYIWRNEAGEEVGRNGDLLNVPAGNYTLSASNDKCYNSFSFTIGNTQKSITPPVMEDILICAPSNVNISFKETADIYRIYNADGTLLAQSSSKDFRVRVDQPGMYYAALGRGSCESTRTPFSISFGSSGLQIPTAFSPNGDGVNDNWMIKGIDVYTTPEIKLFNRQGMMVFHSFGPSQPFDGKSKGADLPVGVYYYMVRASIECPPQNGSLTLIR